jgi:Restriction endonuclease
LEELGKDNAVGSVGPDQLKAETNKRKSWRPAPGIAICAADIPIAPVHQFLGVSPCGEHNKPKEAGRDAAEYGRVMPAYSAFETPWQDVVLECLLKMTPSAFERLCQKILERSGFIKVDVTGRSGDGGIDGIGVLRLNLLSFHVFFQCKRWKGSVGASVIRDFRGAMVGRADKGLVMTTGTFSTDARREATRDGAPAIDLVDGETLCELLKDLEIGVSIKKVEHVLVEQNVFLEF